MKLNVTVLGTGLLGHALSERLLDLGFPVTVWNRTDSKTNKLKEQGARVAKTVGDAVSSADCIILMLSDAKAISDVLSLEDGSLNNKTVIQMGTISSVQSMQVQKKVYKLGGEYLECPVLGSHTEARAGTLILMVGSTQDKFDHWNDFLKYFGPKPKRIGKVGKAAALKLALNHLIAVHAVGFSLSMSLIQSNEIDVDDFMGILKQSALFTPMYENKLNNWKERCYDNPNFSVKHLLKDVNLVVQQAEANGLCTDVIQSIEGVVEKTITQGLGDKDYSAVFEVIKNDKS
ncbi:MAG: 3-hydroxyisobutyrate dehydrogenase [Lysobacterales bacterium]|jgi:3-hydroxyisobutyrate dehydrogenase